MHPKASKGSSAQWRRAAIGSCLLALFLGGAPIPSCAQKWRLRGSGGRPDQICRRRPCARRPGGAAKRRLSRISMQPQRAVCIIRLAPATQNRGRRRRPIHVDDLHPPFPGWRDGGRVSMKAASAPFGCPRSTRPGSSRRRLSPAAMISGPRRSRRDDPSAEATPLQASRPRQNHTSIYRPGPGSSSAMKAMFSPTTMSSRIARSMSVFILCR